MMISYVLRITASSYSYVWENRRESSHYCLANNAKKIILNLFSFTFNDCRVPNDWLHIGQTATNRKRQADLCTDCNKAIIL